MTKDSSRWVDAMMAERAHLHREHLRSYIESDGQLGYLRDMTANGGSARMLHLVVRTIGRRSGRVFLVPLTYSAWGDEYVIVGSRGGHDEHPNWYLNLIARPEVEWQVRDKRFSGSWRVAEGNERRTLWDYVSNHYPGYAACQERTARVIPIVVLTVKGRIPERWHVPDYQLSH